MAIVQGIRERVHLPIYDSLTVKPEEQLREAEQTSTLKFFVDVQKKTKLETNLQSASLLPHYNTFEARAMRVVISDLPPEFSPKVDIEIDGEARPPAPAAPVPRTLSTDLARAMELLDEARQSDDGAAIVLVNLNTPQPTDPVEEDTGTTEFFVELADIEASLLGSREEPAPREFPPREQVRPNNGSGTIIGKLIYNTVTTLYVGEKIMIQMPTWFFPAGAGPYSEGQVITHGEPSPTATFRFAEPIFIDKQQNFRVEIEVPDTDTLKEIQRIYGPLNIWVVLDGYMTRDVQ
ncbi:MAG TPA: hypothetical protein VJ864_18075 [Candidatus Binatia bacterium]|nr:hypothetical protein [Candidatus Binatia bacterium]